MCAGDDIDDDDSPDDSDGDADDNDDVDDEMDAENDSGLVTDVGMGANGAAGELDDGDDDEEI